MTPKEAAKELDLSLARIYQLCKVGRLGYSQPKHGRSPVITPQEIARFRSIGPLPAGAPKKSDDNSAAE